uniref:Uncharacterized protein n=1 Tax=Ciona savignyi TaxID=51511 RepID=H2YMQ7_CIOSA
MVYQGYNAFVGHLLHVVSPTATLVQKPSEAEIDKKEARSCGPS